MTSSSLSRSLVLGVLSLSIPAMGQSTPLEQPAAPAMQPANPAEVAALLQQLSDPDPAKVAEARNKLINLGESARPALEQFLKPRGVADDILSTIETNKVAAGTLITLKIKDGTIDDVLAALTKQAGYPMQMYNRNMFRNRPGGEGGGQTFTLEYENQPFWDVIRDVCAKTGISPYNDDQNRRGMTFMPAANMGGSMFNCPIYISGAALCTMQSLSRSSSITFGQNNPPNNYFNGQMTLMFEPKVKIGSYWSTPVIDEAVDDKGNSLVNKNSNSGGGSSGAGRRSQISLGMAFMYPTENPGTKIVRIRGKARLNVATRTETIEITDFSKEQTKKSSNGKIRLTVRSVKPQADNETNRQYNVQVTFYRDGMEQQKFYEMINNPSLRLVDAAGRELQYNGNNRNDNNENEANQTMTFYRYGRNEGRPEDVGDPAKIIWDLTTDTKEITIPFEFTDLPMP